MAAVPAVRKSFRALSREASEVICRQRDTITLLLPTVLRRGRVSLTVTFIGHRRCRRIFLASVGSIVLADDSFVGGGNSVASFLVMRGGATLKRGVLAFAPALRGVYFLGPATTEQKTAGGMVELNITTSESLAERMFDRWQPTRRSFASAAVFPLCLVSK